MAQKHLFPALVAGISWTPTQQPFGCNPARGSRSLRTEQALHCSLSINQLVSFHVGSMSYSALWLQRVQTN